MKTLLGKKATSEEAFARASQPAEDVNIHNASPRKPWRKKLFITGLGVAMMVVVGMGAYLLNSSSTTKDDSTSNRSIAQESKGGPVFCVKVGLSSLQCEELDTKELKKYELPKTLGEISGMSSSPDGSKYFITAWQKSGASESAEVMSVLDSKLNRIATLPASTNGASFYRVEWLDNDTLVYLTSGSGIDNKSTIKAYAIGSAKESVLIEPDADIERIMPSGDARYLYGIQAQVDSAKNAVVRKLVVIDLQTKEVVDVENGALDTAKESIIYDETTSKFYVNVLRQAEQKFNVDIYTVENLRSKPKISQTGQIKDVYAQGPTAYKTVSTKKGIFATSDMLEWKAPLKLYAKNGESTELSLAVGSYGNAIVLSLPSFPDFPKAETSTIVTSDLFRPTDDIPKKIVTFVEGLADKAEGCDKGEYRSYVVHTYDQDQQFSLSKAGCGDSVGRFFYKASGDSYVQFARSGTHGLSCEDRDKLGISAVVDPNCRKPGEGL